MKLWSIKKNDLAFNWIVHQDGVHVATCGSREEAQTIKDEHNAWVLFRQPGWNLRIDTDKRWYCTAYINADDKMPWTAYIGNRGVNPVEAILSCYDQVKAGEKEMTDALPPS